MIYLCETAINLGNLTLDYSGKLSNKWNYLELINFDIYILFIIIKSVLISKINLLLQVIVVMVSLLFYKGQIYLFLKQTLIK